MIGVLQVDANSALAEFSIASIAVAHQPGAHKHAGGAPILTVISIALSVVAVILIIVWLRVRRTPRA